MKPFSRELGELAEQIRKECLLLLESSRTSLSHARRCGELLNDAKGKVKHGEWKTWLKDNCHLSVRTAQMHMRLANKGDELAAKAQSIADLTIAKADKLLSTPRPETPKGQVTHAPARTVVPDPKPVPDEMDAASVPCPVLSLAKAATPTDTPSDKVDGRGSLLDVLATVASRLELCRAEVNSGDWDRANADAHLSLLADIAASVDAIRSTISVAVAEKAA